MAEGTLFACYNFTDLITPYRAHKDQKHCAMLVVSNGQKISVKPMMQTILLLAATHHKAELRVPLLILLLGFFVYQFFDAFLLSNALVLISVKLVPLYTTSRFDFHGTIGHGIVCKYSTFIITRHFF